MNCEREHECLEYLWGEMEPGRSRDFSLHLESCPTCKAQIEAFGPLVDSMGAVQIEELPERLARRVEGELAGRREDRASRSWREPRRLLGVAASIVLLVGIGVLWLNSLNISSDPVGTGSKLTIASEAEISDEEYVDAMVLVLIDETQGSEEDIGQGEEDIETEIAEVAYQIEELLQEIEQDIGPLEPNGVAPVEQGSKGTA